MFGNQLYCSVISINIDTGFSVGLFNRLYLRESNSLLSAQLHNLLAPPVYPAINWLHLAVTMHIVLTGENSPWYSTTCSNRFFPCLLTFKGDGYILSIREHQPAFITNQYLHYSL